MIILHLDFFYLVCTLAHHLAGLYHRYILPYGSISMIYKCSGCVQFHGFNEIHRNLVCLKLKLSWITCILRFHIDMGFYSTLRSDQ